MDHSEAARSQEADPAKVVTLQPQEFAEQLTTHARVLWCIAAGVLGRREGADDVLQESSMIALTKLEQFDSQTNFVAWMSQIVRYVALNTARKRVRSQASPIDSPIEEKTLPDLSRSQREITATGQLTDDQRMFDDALVRALKDIDETARACLLLRTVLDLPYREIALALDLPEGTAMSHVHRAKRALRDQLSSDYQSERSNS